MQDFLNSIENNYSSYKNDVDGFYGQETNLWKDVFVGIEPVTSPFYQAIFNVIRRFLNEEIKNDDQTPTQLFIQLPTEELGRSDKKQYTNRSFIHKVVSSALQYATAETLYKNTRSGEASQTKEGELYYSLENDMIWSISPSNWTEWRTYPRCVSKSIQRTSDAVRLFNELKDSTIRICASPSTSSAIRSMRECFNKVLSYYEKSLWFAKQYDSATIIGYPGEWCNRGALIENEFIGNPVRFYRNFTKLGKKATDVLVLIGTRKYKNFSNQIRNNLAKQKYKKVIYIGSEKPFNVDDNPKNVTYSFSFRELFTYFYGTYPKIKYYHLEYTWLSKQLLCLKKILENKHIDEEKHKSILTYVAYNFIAYDFKSISSEDFEYTKNKLLEEYYVEVDEWFNNLKLPSNFKNPKVIKRFGIYAQTIPIFLVSHKKSIIKEFIKDGKNKHTNKIIIDVKSNSEKYLDVVKYLLTKGMFGEYNLFTYVDLPRIRDFFEKEKKVYNNPYRINLLDGLKYTETELPHPKIDKKLEDYFDLNILDQILYERVFSSSSSSIAYTLKDKKGNKHRGITGDIIYGDNTMSLNDVIKEKEDMLPAELTYYINPPNFDELVELSHNLGKDVERYAKLWKVRLRNYCNEKYDGDVNKMAKEKFPFMVSQLNDKYIDVSQSTVKFPDRTVSLAQKMLELEIINEEERNNIIAARKVNNQNSEFGRRLKEALFNYKINGTKNELLNSIEKNARENSRDINVDTIVQSALITEEFEDITNETNK